MPNREQERARFALGKIQVDAMNPQRVQDRDKLKTQLLKLPARLHTSGLGQTVAFYLSAGRDKPEARICEWLEQWLTRADVHIYQEGTRLIEDITGGTPEQYRRAGAEARALSVWLKRFAEAFLEPSPAPANREQT